SLRKERLRVSGVKYLPGHGGVLLATDAALPETRKAVRWAGDRLVTFLSATAHEKELQEAERLLKKGAVIALTLNIAGGLPDRHYDRLSLVSGVTILPVHAKPSVVKFGRAVKGRLSADQIRAAI